MDFTRFIDRKSLVRTLRFVQEKEILKISEGSLENVENKRKRETLYENTGLSNYFYIHHNIDISSFANYKDFENIDDNYSDKEKGHIRTRLLLQPTMY